MNRSTIYSVIESIGTFADESQFKKKYETILRKDKERYKDVIEIENTVEPGMPDLIVIDHKDRSYFVEVKYARRGTITFKKTQIPWYRRHRHLNIIIVAYNDKTQNIHEIDSSVLLMKADSNSYKLEDESNYKIEGSL